MKDALRRAIALSLADRRWLPAAITLGFLTIGSAVGLIATSAILISKAALQPSISELGVAIVGVRFFGLTRGIFRYLERLVTHDAIFRALSNIRVWFYRRIEPLAPAGLQKFHSGDLLARLVADVENLEHVFARLLAPPIIAMFVALLLAVIYGSFSLPLLIAVLLFYALAGVVLPVAMLTAGRTTGQRIASRRSDLQILLVDHMQGLADLLAFNRATDHAVRIRRTERELVELQRRMTIFSGLNDAGAGLLMHSAVLSIVLLTVPHIQRGDWPGVMLAMLALTVMSGFEAVAPLPQAFQFAGQCRSAAERLFAMADREPAVRSPADPRFPAGDFTLSMNHVSFTHADTRDAVVSDISFSITPGEHVAWVGPSGAGKTTLANLLLRFHDPQKGTVRLGGIDLRELAPEELPKHISLVPQSPFFFNGTLRENLQMAAPDASDDRIRDVLRIACLEDFIESLPLGLNTDIGEQGLRLSGGERRRLALSQALLRNTPIYIFDEPTADIDAQTERRILENLRTALQDRTMIWITHRLVQLNLMNRIFVLQAGCLAESGTETDLRNRPNGLYRRLLEIQQDGLPETLGHE